MKFIIHMLCRSFSYNVGIAYWRHPFPGSFIIWKTIGRIGLIDNTNWFCQQVILIAEMKPENWLFHILLCFFLIIIQFQLKHRWTVSENNINAKSFLLVSVNMSAPNKISHYHGTCLKRLGESLEGLSKWQGLSQWGMVNTLPSGTTVLYNTVTSK